MNLARFPLGERFSATPIARRAMNTEDFSVVTGRAPRMVYCLFTTAGRIYGARLDGERLLFKRLSRWSPGRVYGLRGCPSMQVLSNCRFIIRFWVCQ